MNLLPNTEIVIYVRFSAFGIGNKRVANASVWLLFRRQMTKIGGKKINILLYNTVTNKVIIASTIIIYYH
jgi:hypothetical protein